MRETQDAINERLGLDYDAFVNSSLLLQGRSDEFTKKRPAERKNILGKVLNLQKYDQLAEKARIRQTKLNSQKEKLEREIEVYSDTLQYEKGWKADFDGASKTLKLKEEELDILKKEESELVANLVTQQALVKELEALDAMLGQHQEQKELRTQENELLSEKIEGCEYLVGQEKSNSGRIPILRHPAERTR